MNSDGKIPYFQIILGILLGIIGTLAYCKFYKPDFLFDNSQPDNLHVPLQLKLDSLTSSTKPTVTSSSTVMKSTPPIVTTTTSSSERLVPVLVDTIDLPILPDEKLKEVDEEDEDEEDD